MEGGRDSSLVLAAATAVARREGLELPVPVTLRFPAVPKSEETAWQELVVRHLRLADWQQLSFADELDLIGPVAQQVLHRHGLLWPSNAYLHKPLLARARGGSLLTGCDGDVLFHWRWERAAGLVSRQVSPRPRDLLCVGLAASPRAVRVRAERRRKPVVLAWLTPEARERVAAEWAVEVATEPRRWDLYVRDFARARYLTVLRTSMRALAADEGAEIGHPLMEPRFLAAVARAGGRFGFGGRTAAMKALFGELLPQEVLERRSKATFDGALWTGASRAYVEGWSGAELFPGLVDADALRREWQRPSPHSAANLLLQAAWLASPAS
jgi:asparagine synthase (glutamine-hydrolysing)